MLLWSEGALNSNEIEERVLWDEGDILKQRIIQFLDNIISSSVFKAPDPPSNVVFN